MSAPTAAEARQIVSEARDRYPDNEGHRGVFITLWAEQNGTTLEEVLALGAPDADEQRASALAQANHMLGLKGGDRITTLRRYLSEPPIWEFEGAFGKAKCSTAQLSEFRSAAVHIVDATGAYPELIESQGKPIKYARVLKSLLAAREDVEVGDVTDDGLVSGWLEDYLCARPPGDEPEEGTRYPYRKDGRIEVYGNDFREWLAQVKSERIQPKHLATMLRSAGCESIKIKVTSETTGRASTTPGWRLP